MATTTWLPLLLLIYEMIGAHAVEYKQFLQQHLSTTCPYNKFCTIGPSKPFSRHDRTPCCSECYCQPDCAKTGRCCPDYPGLESITGPFTPCSIPAIAYTETILGDLDGNNYGIPFYYIIKTCASDFNDKLVIEKCLNPNPDSLMENDIVSDEIGRVFKNKNCAKCNGVQNVRYWKMNILCRRYTGYHARPIHSLNDVRASERCMALFIPPNKVTQTSVMSSRCIKEPLIGTCNETGLWHNYDVNMKRACETPGTTYYYVPDDVRIGIFKVYKNIFCFLCNPAGFPKDEQEICMKYDDDQTRKGPAVTFTMFIDVDVRKWRDDHTNEVHTVCSSSEIYDKYFETCRALKCPLPSTPLNAKCVDMYGEVNGLNIQFYINAKHPNITQIVDTQRKLNDLGGILNDHVSTQLEFKGKDCSKCYTILFLMDDCACIVMMFTVWTTHTCQPNTIIESLQQWASQNQTVTLSDITLTLELAFRDMDNSRRSASRFTGIVSNSDGWLCSYSVRLTGLFYCPAVELSAEEYNQLVVQHSDDVDPEGFTVVQNDYQDYTNITYWIRVDKYLPLLKNQAVANRQLHGTFAMLAVHVVSTAFIH